MTGVCLYWSAIPRREVLPLHLADDAADDADEDERSHQSNAETIALVMFAPLVVRMAGRRQRRRRRRAIIEQLKPRG